MRKGLRGVLKSLGFSSVSQSQPDEPPRGGLTGETIELRWPPHETFGRYRVQVRAEDVKTPVLDTEVEDAALTLPVDRLPSGVTCQWSVWVRDQPEGRWAVHVPPVVLSEPTGDDRPELGWPPAPGAHAYRVVVRDVEKDAVVSKTGFLASPGWVDFSRLDAAHPHRATVEAWIDGGWRQHRPARTVFSPPRRLLRPAPPHRTEALQHVVVVSFTARGTDELYGVQRPKALLIRRLELFMKWTLPSVQGLSSRGVHWALRVEGGLPDPVLAALHEHCGERVLAPGESLLKARRARGIALTWMLAGDAIHPALPAAVERRAAGLLRDQPFGLEFPLAVEADPAGARLVRDPSPRSMFVIVTPRGRPVDLDDGRHPRLQLGSLGRVVSDWGVPAILRARPGPNCHPLHLRERGPELPHGLLSVFGIDVDSPQSMGWA